MRKVTKLTCLLLTGMMAATALTGCTNKPAATSSGAETEKAADQTTAGKSTAEQITLRFMWWGGDARNEATLAVIEQYQKLHPEVKIEAEMNSDQGYIDKISTMLANGTAPDIMQQNVDSLPDFISRGDFFVNFNDYPDLFDTSGFEKTFISQFGTFDDKLLAIPTGMSCLATVANEDAAKTCGIDLSRQITWESMLEDGKKLHEQNPEYFYMNTDTRILCEYVLRPYLRQLTGQSFIIDSEKKMSFTREQLVEVLQYIKDCYSGGVFEPAEDSATFKGQIQTNPMWMDGKFVFAYGPSSSINLLIDAVPDNTCTVVQMPLSTERVNDGFFADTPQYMTVNKNSKHVEEAVKFLDYFYNNSEAQETLKDVRSVPPTSTARNLCAEKKLLNPVVVSAVDLAAGLNGKSDKGYTTSAEVYAIQEDMIESVAYGQSTPEDAADNAIDLINDYLSGLK
ncbi:extracellular solute-binding protein [Lacrimispora celerecrescens]|uniref:Capsular biosynthesis protein n=1 Tax=Lacrimispora celerecrescens TaxID=29354 RepID=A0A084JHV2_9FIRM|nr:extracellular solute-binding protein [Lacrimispora celerecrescens]KEZ88536.1 capsular biosynthesis protein [Lacrimispora celerecrescens]